MNDLKNYVNYVQPVIKAIRDNHNQFHLLQYYTVNAEDLTVSKGLLEFMTEAKNRPEDFNVEVGINNAIPLVYAQYGEETGASLVFYLTPEQRKNLSPEVTKVLAGEYHRERSQLLEEWDNTADKPVFILMEHEYYSDVAGFAPSDSWGGVNTNLEEAIKFLSSAMGITFYTVDNPYAGLDYYLDE